MEKYGILQAFKIIWIYSNAKEKFFLVGLFILNLIRALSPLIPPLILSCIVSKISGEEAFFIFFTFPASFSTFQVILICFTIFTIILFLESATRALIKLYSANMSAKINTCALNLVLEPRKNTKLNLTDGEVNYIIKNASENVAQFLETFLVKFLAPILSAIIAIIYIITIDIITLPVLLATLVLLGGCVTFRMVNDKRTYKDIENISGIISNNSLNVIENLPLINFIKSRANELKISRELNASYFKHEKRRILTYILYWAMVYLVEFGCIIGIFFLILKSDMSTAELINTSIILITYLLKIFDSFTNLGFALGNLQQQAIKVCRLNKIVVPKDKAITFTDEYKLPKSIKISKITIKNLHIKIGEVDKNNINFAFYKNKLNCIVGKSGSGKSTLINYLLGLKEYKEGKIIVNDKYEIKSFFFENKRFSIALQENAFFDRSVVENVAYPEVVLNKKAKQLVKYFNIQELFKRNYYYEQNVNDKSFKNSFSGGEKRRISLIKCFSAKAEVYLLDEPTNDLDDKNLEKLIKLLEKLKAKAVVIMITHDKRLVDISENVIKI